MKEGILICGLVVLMIAGLSWFFVPGVRSVFHTTATVGSSTQASPEKVAEAQTKPKLHKTSQARRVAGETPTAPLENESDRLIQQEPAPVAPVMPFPSEKLVRVGDDENRVVTSFGAPSLIAMTKGGGHDFQTLVYKRDQTQAHIRLRDGHVASVSVR